MSQIQFIFAAIVSTIFSATLAGSIWLFGPAIAAPPAKPAYAQIGPGSLQFVSVSALAFEPVQQNGIYIKDVQRQLLKLTTQSRAFPANAGLFVTPLTLPDGAALLGLTLFGEDFDNQGEVRLRLKRCDHGQAICAILAETTSTAGFAAGQFETSRVNLPNEVVDNRFFTYFLELELTALFNSGPRSVRLEVDLPGGSGSTTAGQWALADNVTSFPLPTSGYTEAQICTDDLSHLDNPTHYPYVVVDGRLTRLSSNLCLTVRGYDIQIRREFNTGPSSGTYRFLR